jgi:quercetin dioxygenase-like cupin family protein
MIMILDGNVATQGRGHGTRDFRVDRAPRLWDNPATTITGRTEMTHHAVQARSYRWEDLSADHPMPKLERRRVVGEKTMVSRVVLDAGCLVPVHRHENEQISCILSGRLRFTVGEPGSEREVELGGGGSLHLPPNVPHGCVALEETVVLDIFTPVSERTGIDLVKG